MWPNNDPAQAVYSGPYSEGTQDQEGVFPKYNEGGSVLRKGDGPGDQLQINKWDNSTHLQIGVLGGAVGSDVGRGVVLLYLYLIYANHDACTR